MITPHMITPLKLQLFQKHLLIIMIPFLLILAAGNYAEANSIHYEITGGPSAKPGKILLDVGGGTTVVAVDFPAGASISDIVNLVENAFEAANPGLDLDKSLSPKFFFSQHDPDNTGTNPLIGKPTIFSTNSSFKVKQTKKVWTTSSAHKFSFIKDPGDSPVPDLSTLLLDVVDIDGLTVFSTTVDVPDNATDAEFQSLLMTAFVGHSGEGGFTVIDDGGVLTLLDSHTTVGTGGGLAISVLTASPLATSGYGVTALSIPEPGSCALLTLGGVVLTFWRRQELPRGRPRLR